MAAKIFRKPRSDCNKFFFSEYHVAGRTTAVCTALEGGGEHEKAEKKALRDRRGACGGGIFRRGDVHFVLLREGAAFCGGRAAHNHRHISAEVLERGITYEGCCMEKSEAVCGFFKADVRNKKAGSGGINAA